MRVLLGILLSLLISCVSAEENLQPLPAEKAFTLNIDINTNNEIILNWQIAPDYYLYRDQIKISVEKASQVKTGKILYPNGVMKQDKIRGSYQIYKNNLTLVIPLVNVNKQFLDLSMRYQGCSAKGFCYTPVHKTLRIDLNDLHPPQDITNFLNKTVKETAYISEQESVKNIFNGKSFLVIIVSFLGLGLLLAFTPCVLPMIPILSGIIMGHRKKQLTIGKSFLLSLSYVLGMAVTYAIAGIVIALIGSRIQSELQRPWVIFIFSGLFVGMALSLFGLYKLQIPVRWQQRLTSISNRQKGGHYMGVFFMGSIASLIVTPCISPPLVGVLAYIAQTGDIWLGATALLLLGIGMGIPLLLIGASAGKLLPKAGPWMEVLEKIMGVIMLGFAIWIISRVIPGPLTLFLWSVLLISLAIFMDIFSRAQNDRQLLKRSLGLVIFVYGIILMVGALLGNSNPLRPLENWKVLYADVAVNKINIITPNNREKLDQALLQAKQAKKRVMLDFYADWCESCVRMERYVFNRPDIQQALSEFVILRINVTANNEFDRATLKRFNVIAPPTFLFFDKNGQELQAARIIGEKDATEFLIHLTRIQKETERADSR